MKVDDPQLSSVCLVIHCFLRVNLLFRKFVGCGGPKLTGGASGRGVLRGTFGPGPKKKKKKKKETMGITILPPRRFWFLILFSFCLPTVQLHFTPILNFKLSTHAKKICLQSFPIHYICTFLFYFFVNKRHTHTHTQRALLGCY